MMTEPEIIELDGHKLAIPPGHPGFEKDRVWEWNGLDDGMPCPLESLTKAFPDWRRLCAADAFAFWMFKWQQFYKNIWPDIQDAMGTECNYAMEWAKWGGLDKIAEGE